MKLSQISPDDIPALTQEQKTNIIYGGFSDDGGQMDAAFLLGGHPRCMPDRAKACVKLYGENRIQYSVSCGGVSWDADSDWLTEAEFMEKILKNGGIPEDRIILDNESRTTKENMMCATLQLSRKMPLSTIRRVLIVTSASHLRRSVALAKLLLPRTVAVFGYPADSAFDAPDKWMNDGFMEKRLDRELLLLRSAIIGGLIDDIEF